jgi:very-short-patch-repair endonuclease
MGYQSDQASRTGLLKLAENQHGVVARRQLLQLGFHSQAIKHWGSRGRLHRVCRGVYAIGRPQLTQYGRWMAAVLAGGPEALLSDGDAAALWEISPPASGEIEISVPSHVRVRRPGLRVHRRVLTASDRAMHHGIPVTSVVRTLVDLAARQKRDQVERAINEADRRDLIDPEALRSALEALPPSHGVVTLRQVLDRRTFTLTDSELERRFLPIVRSAGLPQPHTRHWLNGFRVDFYWPGLGLVVETDGLRYHRTPAQQARDRLRDQAHAAAGLTPLRFTRAQVRFEPGHVQATLEAVARRLTPGTGATA